MRLSGGGLSIPMEDSSGQCERGLRSICDTRHKNLMEFLAPLGLGRRGTLRSVRTYFLLELALAR